MASTNIQTHNAQSRGITRWVVQMISSLLVFGVILFLTAGRWNWAGGWVFLGMNALTQALSAWILIPSQPGMIAERSKIREGTKSWDRILAPAILIIGTFAVVILAGLDARFQWTSSIPIALWLASIALAFASQMFVLWSMASNPFFSTTVRIQYDRGHTVAQSGPYRFVRHPGYAGSLVYNLAMPLVLGSLWAYIPSLITIILLFIRTRLEDRALHAELPGYLDYAGAVRYRLIPGVW